MGLWSKTSEKFELSVSIRDKENKWISILRLHKQPAMEGLSGEPLKLIEISKGFKLNHIKPEFGLDEWMLEERPKSSPKYEYYHVL